MNNSNAFAWTTLLRNPALISELSESAEFRKSILRSSLLSIAIGCAVFGAALGSFRGGWQTLFAATKVPLVFLATLIVFAPAFFQLARTFRIEWTFQQTSTLLAASLARAALILAAVAPLLWLGFDLKIVNYHEGTLAAVLAMSVAGSYGLSILRHSTSLRGGNALAFLCIAFGLFFAGLAQTSWVLRPYLVRPRAEQVVFLRSIEGSFVESTSQSTLSSVGIYKRGAPAHANELVEHRADLEYRGAE